MYYSLLSLKMISFVLLPQASQPSMNFNQSELVYCNVCIRNVLFLLQTIFRGSVWGGGGGGVHLSVVG